MKRQRVIGGLILLGAILIATLLVLSRSEPVEKPIEEVTPLVQAVPLEIRSGSLRVSGAGTVRSREELTLAAEVAGKLVYVNPNLREGQRVAKGSTLFRIDTSDYLNAVQTAQADVAAQDVAVLQAREEVTLAKAELEQFQQRGVGSASYSNDDNDAGGILPPDSLAKPTTTGPTKTKSSPSNNGLVTRQPQLNSALAGLKRAQANLANAQTALKRTVVRAPFSGVVRSEQVALGSFVQPGQSLGSIVGTAEYEAVIPLSEKEAALIPKLFRNNNGSLIEASIYSTYGGRQYRWRAFVDRVNSVLNPQTRTIDVYLRIPNPQRGGVPTTVQQTAEGSALSAAAPPLFVGKFVSAEIEGVAMESYAVIPLAALHAGNKIWTVRDGKLDIVDVDLLQRTDTSALVNSKGLSADTKVVTGGLNVATKGLRVRIAKPRTAPKTTTTATPK